MFGSAEIKIITHKKIQLTLGLDSYTCFMKKCNSKCFALFAVVTIGSTAITDGSAATPGVDFTSEVSREVTIDSGDTMTTINVPILGDIKPEAVEYFDVTLTSTDHGVIRGPVSTRVTINDDDGKDNLCSVWAKTIHQVDQVIVVAASFLVLLCMSVALNWLLNHLVLIWQPFQPQTCV